MTRLDDTADRVELRALVDRYALAADSRDRAGFAGVFTADGVLAIGPGGGLVGPDAIPAPLDYLDAHYTHTMHFIGTHDVVLDGDTATGTVYCLAHHLWRATTRRWSRAWACATSTATYAPTTAGASPTAA